MTRTAERSFFLSYKRRTRRGGKDDAPFFPFPIKKKNAADGLARSRRKGAPFLKTADGRGIFAPRLRHNRAVAFCRPEENAMIRTANDLRTVKEEIRRYADRRVRVHVCLGRNKYADFTGRLSGVYPALFTVLPDDAAYRGKTAYSYAEVVCGSVSVKACPSR